MVGRTSLRRRRWAGSARNGFRHAVVAAAPALAAGSATGLTAADACSRQRPRQTRTHTSKSAAPNPAPATTQEAQRPPRRRRQATGKPEKRSRVRFLPSAAGGPPTSRAPQSAEWVRTTSQSPSRRTALRTGFRRSFRYAMRSGFVLASHHVVEALAAPASVRPTSFYSRRLAAGSGASTNRAIAIVKAVFEVGSGVVITCAPPRLRTGGVPDTGRNVLMLPMRALSAV